MPVYYPRHAKNLFKILRESKKEVKKEMKKTMVAKEERSIEVESDKEDTDRDEESPILGHYFKRKTRFRPPTVHLKLTRQGDGKIYSVYNKMEFGNLEVIKESNYNKILKYSAFCELLTHGGGGGGALGLGFSITCGTFK